VDDPSIQIRPDSSVPIYRQIVDQIRTHIESGALSTGDALPSVRSLSTQLGIHFNTVAEAYRELADEGSIELKQGRRAVVGASGSVRPAQRAEADSLLLRLRHLVAEMRLKGISTCEIEDEVNAVIGR
jgi:GntR family transcriptional regulator